jgi:hypothetical protein
LDDTLGGQQSLRNIVTQRIDGVLYVREEERREEGGTREEGGEGRRRETNIQYLPSLDSSLLAPEKELRKGGREEERQGIMLGEGDTKVSSPEVEEGKGRKRKEAGGNRGRTYFFF